MGKSATFLSLALGLALAAGCDSGEAGGTGTRAPGVGRARGIQLVDERMKPATKPVTRYGAAVEHAPTDVERVLVKTLDAGGMSHEPALSAMTRELALTAPDHLNMPPALVDGLLAWFGLVDPPPRVVVVEIPADQNECHRRADGPCVEPMQALVEEVGKTVEAAAAARFGVAAVRVDNGNTRMMVAIVDRMVELEELPVSVAPGATTRVSGKLVGARSAPRLEVVDPKGRWHEVPTVSGTDGSFAGTVACDRGRGTYQVEVMASGAHGPEVAANFPLYCGVARPASIPYEIEHIAPSVTAADVAAANFDYLNRERRTRGLPPLDWDPAAATVARGHAGDMYQNGFVGHVSPGTGDVTQRFAKAKVHAAVIRENVARGYGPKGIHESLMNSPGHRVNIVATDVTHVGIGVVIGDPETAAAGAPRPVFLTQNFYKKPGAGAPKDLPGGTRTAVDEKRKEAGLGRLRWDDALSKIAQKKAEAVAKGRPGLPDEEFQQRVFALGYGALARHQVASSDHAALATLEVWTQLGKADFVGIGIARVPEARGQPPGFVLIIVVAQK